MRVSKQQDAMVQHQQMMKGGLYDVVESFDTFEQTDDEADNPNFYITLESRPAFGAHREALEGLGADIAQHQQAMVELLKKCPQMQ